LAACYCCYIDFDALDECGISGQGAIAYLYSFDISLCGSGIEEAWRQSNFLVCRRSLSFFRIILLVYANSAFADPLLGLIVASSIFCLEFSVYPITLGCLMILGAWVKFQFLPIALILVVLSFLRYSSKNFLKIIIVSAGGIIALIVFNLMEYGHISPPMRWLQSNPIEAFHYFFVEPSTSILIRNPWLIAVLTAFCLPQVRHAIQIAPSFWLLLGSLIIVPLSWGFYSGGYCYPGRLILPALIPAALLFGALFDIAEKKGKIMLCLSLAASILVNFAASVSDPRATWAPTLEWLGVLSSPFLN
jgi:hypothetical protein